MKNLRIIAAALGICTVANAIPAPLPQDVAPEPPLDWLDKEAANDTFQATATWNRKNVPGNFKVAHGYDFALTAGIYAPKLAFKNSLNGEITFADDRGSWWDVWGWRSTNVQGGIGAAVRSVSLEIYEFFFVQDGRILNVYRNEDGRWEESWGIDRGYANTGTTIAGTSRHPDTIEFFYVQGGAILHSWWYKSSGVWSHGVLTGGSGNKRPVDNTITAVTKKNGIEIFWAALDGSIQHGAYYNEAWSFTERFPPGTVFDDTKLKAVVQADSSVFLFWFAPAGERAGVYCADWSALSGWRKRKLPLQTGKAPGYYGQLAAFSKGVGHIEVFYSTSEGEVWHVYNTGNGWLNQQLEWAGPGTVHAFASMDVGLTLGGTPILFAEGKDGELIKWEYV